MIELSSPRGINRLAIVHEGLRKFSLFVVQVGSLWQRHGPPPIERLVELLERRHPDKARTLGVGVPLAVPTERVLERLKPVQKQGVKVLVVADKFARLNADRLGLALVEAYVQPLAFCAMTPSRGSKRRIDWLVGVADSSTLIPCSLLGGGHSQDLKNEERCDVGLFARADKSSKRERESLREVGVAM